MEEEAEVSRRLLSARMTMSLGAVYTGLKEEELTMRGRRRLPRPAGVPAGRPRLGDLLQLAELHLESS